MKPSTLRFLFLPITFLASSLIGAAEDLPIPPQDKGLPYTRSAQEQSLGLIPEVIAVYPGSRYAYVEGHRVRLEPTRLRDGEAVEIDGKLWVPTGFASALFTDNPTFDKAPDYLANRYVFTLQSSEQALPEGTPTRSIGAITYTPLGALTETAGLTLTQAPRGIRLISKGKIDTSIWSDTAAEALVTLFDTPEKYADPDIAIRYVPHLKRQGDWQQIAPTSAEDLALLDGPEPVWPEVAEKTHSLEGFDPSMLGSKVPAPGIYPRLLFSEADLPAFRQRIDNNIIAQKTWIEIAELLKRTWLDPSTDDGKVFNKLASGEVSDLEWDAWQGGRRVPLFPGTFTGFKPGIYNSHVAYNSQCLVTIALYALVSDDDELGAKAAKAIACLYRMQEPNLDRFLEFSDSELGATPADATASTSQWRSIASTVAHMDLPFALDFAGKWMSPEEKADMARFIAKASYGRRTNGGDGPRRNWRDVNHVTWHLTHLLSLAAIEGLEGFDPAAYESGAELVSDFLQWGIDADGRIYESNGKSSAGLVFEVLSMNVLARRGQNLWGHPHWRKLMLAEAMNTAPNGEIAVSSGTWSGGLIATPVSMMYHGFYPKNRYTEFLLSCDFGSTASTFSLSGKPIKDFDLNAYRNQLKKAPGKTRLPGPNTPAFTLSLLYDTDWKHTTREELTEMPLDYVNDDYGVFAAFSDRSEDATWLQMQARSSHYLGAGHHHADAGMFHFSALGVNWITESPFLKSYAGRFHNQVLIDGIAQPDDIQGRADWLGAETTETVSMAAADLTQSYSWIWKNQFIYFDTDHWGPQPDLFEWSLCKDPVVLKAFKGTQRYKMRPWWATSNAANWTPVLQRPYNPVEYAFRGTALIRGKHSYGLILDDIKKDDATHHYQWSSMPGPGVWAASGYSDLPTNMQVLTKQGTERAHPGAKRFRAKDGDPMLLVVLLGGQGVPSEFESGPSNSSKFALNPHAALEEDIPAQVTAPIRIETRSDGPHWQNSDQIQFFYDQIIGGCHSNEAHFQTLLIPFRHGEQIPNIKASPDGDKIEVVWPDQVDQFHLKRTKSGRTTATFSR